MKFLICLVFFILIFNGFTAKREANSLIEKYCKQSSKHLETYFYEFCVAAFKENPESQKARNTEEITVLGTKNALANLTNVKKIVENIVKERKYKGRLAEKLLQDCLKLYSVGYNELTSTFKYIKARDSFNYSFSLGNAKSALRMCEMGFNGYNKQISPVKKENNVLYDMINIPYNFLSHSMKRNVKPCTRNLKNCTECTGICEKDGNFRDCKCDGVHEISHCFCLPVSVF